jgi:hypothetical protein
VRQAGAQSHRDNHPGRDREARSENKRHWIRPCGDEEEDANRSEEERDD